MKLINYNYGYNNTFNCSIHGKIIVTPREWKRAIAFLKRTRKWARAYTHVDTYKQLLKEDLERKIEVKKGYYVNIRVPATQGIAEKFKLDKYKRANYVFFVKNA